MNILIKYNKLFSLNQKNNYFPMIFFKFSQKYIILILFLDSIIIDVLHSFLQQ